MGRKVKVIDSNINQYLVGGDFNNTTSQTIFSYGNFSVTTNISARNFIDYSNTLTSFTNPVSLETLNLNRLESELLYKKNNSVILNLDNSDLKTMCRFGSAFDFFRVSIENILIKYPGSLYINNIGINGGDFTYYDYVYDYINKTSTFKVPVGLISNPYQLIYKYGDYSVIDDNELRNLNISYENYNIWLLSGNNDNNMFNIIGFTGSTNGNNYLSIKVNGNPFTGVNGYSKYHIKPNTSVFEKYRIELGDYERFIVSNRLENKAFSFILKEPTMMDNGDIVYLDTTINWPTNDGYNLDYSGQQYDSFFTRILAIASKYDTIKTDLIYRFLTPTSLKMYDNTDNKKVEKVLKVYGREFDEIRKFIDSLTYINYLSYDKIKNAPDILIKNIANTFGWKYFSLLDDNELIDSFFTIDEQERNLNENLLPSEINLELWRRILINTNYYWKTKGTREALRSIFLLIGIPEPFINITEYVYTVDNAINPNTINLTETDFANNVLPFDTNGYPKAPIESNSFYFQISGTTDSGQAYMNNFRKAGFNLKRVVDNKKSWPLDGNTFRVDDLSPDYYQEDSRLVLNTKEIDVCLDAARGIEYDVFEYLKKDYIANSTGYTLPYTYINISLGVTDNQNTFPLPNDYDPDNVMGHLEVRFNGILLNAPNVVLNADYSIDENTKTFTLLNDVHSHFNSNHRDVVQATFIYNTREVPISGITIQYLVNRLNADITGTKILLPSTPNGDVQLTVNGIALTKSTSQFMGDYTINYDTDEIIIQNVDLIAFLSENPEVQISYVNVIGSDDINVRSEIHRIDSYNSNKLSRDHNAGKFKYKMNYRVSDAKNIKVLIDGITLEPYTDYTINPLNRYELYLPYDLRYGMIISVYYLVGGESIFNPIILTDYEIGDITKMSFLKFVEEIRRKLIKVPNRKTITDFNGGWYPLLLRLYTEYLKRSSIGEDNPLVSNGYTFNNLHSFISKYNSLFHKFFEQIVPATVILRKSGLLTRNTIFTPQKFTYKRGVNLVNNNVYASNLLNTLDFRGHHLYEYLGDNGSLFKIKQQRLQVETKEAELFHKTISTGGINVVGFPDVVSYGIAYRKRTNDIGIGQIEPVFGPWQTVLIDETLTDDHYEIEIIGEYNEVYEYYAVVYGVGYGYSGQTLSVFLDEFVLIPTIKTCQGETTSNTIITGGYEFTNNLNTDTYGMQYRCIGNVNDAIFNLSQNTLAFDYNSSSSSILVSGNTWNCYDVIKSPELSWISVSNPGILNLTGVESIINVSKNLGNNRSGVICYVPTYGQTKYLTIEQDARYSNYNAVYFNTVESINEPTCKSCTMTLNTNEMNVNDNYLVSFGWYGTSPQSNVNTCNSVLITCNDTRIYECNIVNNNTKQISNIFPKIGVNYNDDIKVKVVSTSESTDYTPTITGAYVTSITEVTGKYCVGDKNIYTVGFKAETDFN